jgi:hypothetical protein
MLFRRRRRLSAPPSSAELASERVCGSARRWILAILVLCAGIQLLLDAGVDNVSCVAITVIVSTATFHLLLKGATFRAAPLPALVVLSFNVATMSGALVTQTLVLRPLVFNLRVPEITFGSSAAFQCTLVAALMLATRTRLLKATGARLSGGILKRLGLMEAPAPGQLWLMGLVGVVALIVSIRAAANGPISYGNVSAKVTLSLTYLAFAPYLIPILHSFGLTRKGSSSSAVTYWPLLPYTAVIVLTAVAQNSRGTFATGVANLILAVGMAALLGQFHASARTKRWIAAGIVAAVLTSPFLSDLATAMVIVRGTRSTVSPISLVADTWRAFLDKDALAEYRRAGNVFYGHENYEENYAANPFVGRFIQTKFLDNTLSYEDVRSGRQADQVWTVTAEKLAALLPTPLLNKVGSLDKSLLEFSMGDYLFYLQYGFGLGQFKVGSSIGHGFALVGPFVFLFAIPLFVLAFICLEALTARIGDVVVISPVILLQLMTVYYLACGDSLLDPLLLVLRGLPQTMFIYIVTFQITRWIGAVVRRPVAAAPKARLGRGLIARPGTTRV